MTEELNLEAKIRDTEGGSANKALRREGSIPAVIYGGGVEPKRISIMEKDITKASEIAGFKTQILKVSLSGKNESVVVKELQRHPYTNRLVHADFMRVNLDSRITLSVPIRFINEDMCVGVKNQGGVVSHLLNDIEVSCLASNLPEHIEIDIDELELGASILLSEMNLPEGVEIPILTKGEGRDQTVVSITESKVIDIEPEIEAVEGEEGEEGVEAEGEEEGEATAETGEESGDSSEASKSSDDKK